MQEINPRPQHPPFRPERSMGERKQKPHEKGQPPYKPRGPLNGQGHRINHMIKAPEVRVVYENSTGENTSEVMSLSKALNLSHEQGVDLIEISPKANPPVCKLMDYGKFTYREQKSHKKDKHTKSKEIGCHVNIAEHDLNTKLRHAEDFLSHGHSVVFKVQFRGRETIHKEIGLDLLKNIQGKLTDFGNPEGAPKLNGKLAMLRFSPKRQNKV
jgi:translation initiation factor IF-3